MHPWCISYIGLRTSRLASAAFPFSWVSRLGLKAAFENGGPAFELAQTLAAVVGSRLGSGLTLACTLLT